MKNWKRYILTGCGSLFALLVVCGIIGALVDPNTETSRAGAQPSAVAVGSAAAKPVAGTTVVAVVEPTATLIPAAELTTVAMPIPTVETTSPPTPEPTPESTSDPVAYPLQPDGLVQATVVEVIDGDTVDVRLDGKIERLRLIGLDTPETKDPRKPVQCFGKEASAQAAKTLTGQTVLLEEDPSQDTRDKYNRLLRYVWLPDGKLYNLEMIIGGFAHEYTYETPYKYQAVFKKEEAAARERGWGFWAVTSCNGNTEQAAESPQPTAAPARAAPPTSAKPAKGNCDPAYPDVCIPPAPPDLDCNDITHRRFRVLPPDPHRFDGRDNDGIGCESG
ncbi:MAG: thermonuclease family protein [Chloroflexota bacterium]|nr:thermonuclease family protein [Chloroflexota bacterium]